MTEPRISVETPQGAPRTRRRWLFGAVAAAAALSGVGWAWRRQPLPLLAEPVEPALWQQQFMTPEGTVLTLASMRGRPLLLNFWATWCPPCVEELPLLSSFFLQNSAKGWNVVGLAVDQSEPVKRFLQQHPVTFPIALAGTSGLALGKSLGNLSAGLPFTVVLGSDGLVAHRKMGKVKPDDLQAWATLS